MATYHQVDVLDIATGATVGAITNPDISSLGWTVAAPTGNRVYAGSNGTINVIDTTTDTVAMSWPIGTNSPVTDNNIDIDIDDPSDLHNGCDSHTDRLRNTDLDDCRDAGQRQRK